MVETMPDGAQPVEMVLTRGEMLLVASLLGRTALPGLDDESAATPEAAKRDERAAAMSLLHRRLARLDSAGKPQIDRRVLTAVRACAFPRAFVIMQRYDTERVADRLVMYLSNGHAVQQRSAGPAKYRLTVSQGVESALEALQAFCLGPDAEPARAALQAGVTEAGLDAARAAARQGDLPGARARLAQAGAPADVAQALAAFLAAPHTLVVVQSVVAGETGGVTRLATIAHGSAGAWLMVEAPGSTDRERKVAVSTLAPRGLRGLLAKLGV